VYTYRYSREVSIQISWVCPICLHKTTITHEDQVIPRWYITTHELCCTEEHRKEYERRIHKAIAWAKNEKVSRLDVSRKHYDSVYTKGSSKYTTVAQVLANLSEYFPFAPKDKYGKTV